MDRTKPIFLPCSEFKAERVHFQVGANVQYYVEFDRRKFHIKALQFEPLGKPPGVLETPKKAANRPSAKFGIISEVHRGGRYGFIEPMDGGSLIFVHCIDIQGVAPKPMATGTRVVYEELFDIHKVRARSLII